MVSLFSFSTAVCYIITNFKIYFFFFEKTFNNRDPNNSGDDKRSYAESNNGCVTEAGFQ